MANQLTVIIPFLNEGQEIGNTLQSIRETAGSRVDILLVNDASYDNFEYEKFAEKYEASYICNEKRMGVARSRDIGVQHVDTDCFMIIDGHMRFYRNDWWRIIPETVKSNDRALYCCKCKALDSTATAIEGSKSFGAFLELYDEKTAAVLSPVWIRNDMYPDKNQVDIPCVLGASYSASKQYWTYLKGLSGLRMYGSDEAYISLKIWLEGGKCVLLKDIETGHIFRNEFPYYVNNTETLFNKLLVAETLLPEKHKDMVYNTLRRTGGIMLRDAMELMLERTEEIRELKTYCQKISTRTFESFIEFNNRFYVSKRIV
ncbi:MAG: glycosyltransferase [Prevotellaceae bacterium]|jgi:glycosyltransferase involved in cell wall biosynthesis|nr:glycosyltransferase [Prevotellaceae bacterium]